MNKTPNNRCNESDYVDDSPSSEKETINCSSPEDCGGNCSCHAYFGEDCACFCVTEELLTLSDILKVYFKCLLKVMNLMLFFNR